MSFTFRGTYTQNRGDAPAAGTVAIKNKSSGATLDTATLDEDGSYELVLDEQEGEMKVVETITGVPVRIYEASVSRGSVTDTSRDIGYVGPGAAQSGASVADLSAYVGDVSLQADEGLALGSGEAPYNNGPGSLAIQVTDGEGTYATVDMLPNGTILLSGESVRLSGTATRVAGDAVGFYTTPAIAKPSGVAVTVEAIHAALVALGLIAGP